MRNLKYQKNPCLLYEVITLPFSLSYFGSAKSSLGLKWGFALKVRCILIPVRNQRATCIYTMQQLQGWVILHHSYSVLSTAMTKHLWGEKKHQIIASPWLPSGSQTWPLHWSTAILLLLYLLMRGRQKVVVFWDVNRKQKATKQKPLLPSLLGESLAASELQIIPKAFVCGLREQQTQSKGCTLWDQTLHSSIVCHRWKTDSLWQALGMS